MARDVSVVGDRPSAWLARFAPLIPAGGRVLEVACGNGRNTRCLLLHGLRPLCVDINEPDPSLPDGAEFRRLDLEAADWPLSGETFDAVVAINYLHRPRFGALLDCLRPGGLLLYETYTGYQGQRLGRPADPAHWLRHNELLELVRERCWLIAYEEGRTDFQTSVARVAATRRGGPDRDEPRLCCPR